VNAETQHTAPTVGSDLDEITRRFDAISGSLLEAYQALSSRAEAVEEELRLKNAEVEVLATRLHAADKMAALGTMAGGIAHEIRNPLNAIRGFARLLEGEVDNSSKSHRWASLIVEGADLANAIIESMSTFATPNQLSVQAIDGASLIASAVEMVLPEGAARTNWEVKTSCSESAQSLTGDPIKLRQALRNLIANAVEAQPEGGPIHVFLNVEGNTATFRVEDGGPGIPAEFVKRIKDPFFTTRPEGTGLGLALVTTIAQLHGGDLVIDANPSELGGAVFSLSIPMGAADRALPASDPRN